MLNLVFIHGTGNDHRTWQGQREFFAGSHNVLDVGLPGRGSRVDEPPLDSHEDNARDVLLRMDAAGMSQAVLIGHSAGGAVAMMIALQIPDRVLALVLVATGARLDVSPGVLDAARRRAEGHPAAPAHRADDECAAADRVRRPSGQPALRRGEPRAGNHGADARHQL